MSYTKHFTPNEIIDVITDIRNANSHSISQGEDDTIAMEVVSESGYGKSSIFEQYAKDNNLGFYILNLPSLTEETQITGYPRETYLMQLKQKIQKKDNEGVITESIVVKEKNVRVNDMEKHLKDGWILLQEDSEMTYSPPAFVNYLAKFKKGSILLMDESMRSLPHIMQGTLNLTNNGRFANWKLPSNCLRVEANNPNTEDYSVNEVDKAGRTRKFTYRMKFDITSWMQWASKRSIVEECMNFFYMTEEARDYENKTANCPNPRVWVRFFRSIAHLDLRKKENWNIVHRNGVGSIGEDFVVLFQFFLDNNLDIIPSLKWLFDGNTNHIAAIKAIREAVIDSSDPANAIIRSDIQGLLGMRLKTFLRGASSVDTKFIERLLEIIKANVLGEDISIMIIFDIFSSSNPHPNGNKFKSQLVNLTKVREILTNNNIDFS